MQIMIDTEILETIFTHATTAARLAGYIDDPIAVDGTSIIDEVTKSLEKIGRLVAAQLGKPYGLRPEGDPLLDSEPEFDVAVSVDGLRQRVSRVDALATTPSPPTSIARPSTSSPIRADVTTTTTPTSTASRSRKRSGWRDCAEALRARG